LLGPWDHDLNHTGRGKTDQELAWLDAWVKGDKTAQAYEAQAPAVEVQTVDGRYRTEKTWPPSDVVGRDMPILGGTYVDGGMNFSETGLPPVVTGAIGIDGVPVALPTGKGSWTFTPPLAEPIHIAGQATANIHVRSVVPNTTLVALLYDVDPGGHAQFVARGAHLTREAGNQVVTVTLYPNDWQFAAGHRVGLLLSNADGVWLEAGVTGTPVRILEGTLTLPALTKRRISFLSSGPYPVLPQDPPFQVPARVIGNRTAR
jgi:predicted acyl esterase